MTPIKAVTPEAVQGLVEHIAGRQFRPACEK